MLTRTTNKRLAVVDIDFRKVFLANNWGDTPGGYCHAKAVGVCRQSHMEHMEREREIKKFMVTKRELLNNLSDIYKCKVSPGGTFSLGNFLFDERENYQV